MTSSSRKFRKVLGLTLTFALIQSTQFASATPSVKNHKKQAIKKITSDERVQQAAQEKMQRLALKLLVYNSLVASKTGELVEVDEEVRKLYGNIRGSFLGTVPTAVAVGVATTLANSSLKRFEYIIKPIQDFVRRVGLKAIAVSEAGAERSGDVMRFFKIDIALEKSFRGLEVSSEKVIVPFLNYIGSAAEPISISSGALSVGAIAGSSIFFLLNPTAEEALTYDIINKFLGQNDAIRKSLDELVENLSSLVELNAEQKSKLKAEVFTNLIKQAANNEFNTNSDLYSIDVLNIMKEKNIVDTDTIRVIDDVRSVFEGSTTGSASTMSPEQTEDLMDSVDQVSALHAILSRALVTQPINDPSLEKEIEALLGKVSAKLQVIGYTTRK